MVWEEEGYIYYTNKPPDGNWSTPTAISGCPQNSYDPALTVDTNNALHLVWWSSDLIGLYGVLYAFKPNGSTWSSPERIAPDSSEIEGTDVAVDSSGTVHAVWSYPLSDSHYVWHASKPPGGTWSSPANLSSNFSYSTDPSIAVDSADTVHVVWKGTSYGDYEILYACKPDGGSWTSPFNVSDDSAASYEPSLAVDDADALHVVWRDSTWSVLYKTRPGGGEWQATELVGSNMLGLYRAPVIAVEGDGKHVAWQSPRGEIFFAYKLGGAAWSVAENVSNSLGSSGAPDLVVDDTGMLHLVWEDDTLGSREILYSSGTPGVAPPPNPPSDLVATAISSTAITLSWHDNSGDESDFHIERSPDGTSGWLQIATSGSNATSYQDDGLTCNETYYYRVRAHRHGDAQYSAYSNTASATTQTCSLPAPSGLSAISVSSGTIDLTWQDNSMGESDFHVERSPNGVSGWIEIATVGADVTTYQNTGLACDTTYYYRVRAHRHSDGQYSDYSNIANASTQTCPVLDLSASSKEADRSLVIPGGSLLYTITLTNTGNAVASGARLTDTLPAQVTWANNLSASNGSWGYSPASRAITWTGTVSVGVPVAVTFQVTVSNSLPVGTIVTNTVAIHDGVGTVITRSAWVMVYQDDIQGPVIGIPSYLSSVPNNEPVTVTVQVSDQTTGGHGVLSATLRYGYVAPYTQSIITGSGPGGNGDGVWTFVIPAQGDVREGQTLRFSLEACDGDNSPACSANDDGGGYFAIVVADDDMAAPTFTNPAPITATDSMPIILQVDVADPSGIYDTSSSTASVYLEWDTDGELDGDVAGRLGMGLSSGDTYQADAAIGPFPAGTAVVWRAWAEDDDNSRSGAWSPAYTLDIHDDDAQGPAIGAPSYASSVPSDEPVTVTVQVSDQATGGHGVLSATLRYGYTAPYNQSSVPGGGPGGDGDGLWIFVISAQGDVYEGQTLRFFLDASDNDDSPACSVNNNGGNYFAVAIGDDDTQGPVIGAPAYSSPTLSNASITVTVGIFDQATGTYGVLSATLSSGYAAPYNQHNVSGSGPGGNGDGTWTFVIPAQGDAHEGQTLRFSLEACDGDNSPACSVNDGGGSHFAVAIADDDAAPPLFTNNTPTMAADSESVFLQVEITDSSGVYDDDSSTASVYLEWDTDGELDDDVAGSLDMDLFSGDTYRADMAIGPFPAGTVVVWRVWAEDDDNSRSGAWSPVYTVDIRDDDTQGPVIGVPSYAGSAPSDEPVTVTVQVSDQATGGHGVLSATLRYGYAAPDNQSSISGGGPGGNGDGTWTFVIPAQDDAHEGQMLRFFLDACDNDNSPVGSVNDNGGNYFEVMIGDQDVTPPAFSNQAPITATDDMTILLQVDITDPSGVYDTSSSTAPVYLEWDTDGKLEDDVAGVLGMDPVSGATYRAGEAIGPFGAGTTVVWHVWAQDNDNSRSEAWSPIYTLDVQDDDAQGPAIGVPSYASSVPSNEPLTITVAVSDHIAGDHGVFSTTLRYGYTAPYDQRSLSGSGPGGNGDGVWTFVLPAQGDAREGQALCFSLEACDGDNSPACSSGDNGGDYFAVTVTDDDTAPPAFSNPMPPTAVEEVSIVLGVEIADPSGVYDTSSSTASVYLEWDSDGALDGDVAGSLGMDLVSTAYQADTAIGPFPAGAAVVWRVWAEDNDNSHSGAWSPVYTLEVLDDDIQGPAIGVPSCASSVPSNEPLTVTVAVSDHIAGDHGVFSTTLRYGYTAPYDQHSLSRSDPGGNGDGVWTFVLPAQGDASEGQTLRFSLEACDGDNSPACSVNDDGSEYYGVQITTPSHWLYLPLVLNGFR